MESKQSCDNGFWNGCITLNERGNTKKPAGPAKAIDLHAMEEGELNELFIPATGGRKRVKRALGK